MANGGHDTGSFAHHNAEKLVYHTKRRGDFAAKPQGVLISTGLTGSAVVASLFTG
jgi:hypothetical protein